MDEEREEEDVGWAGGGGGEWEAAQGWGEWGGGTMSCVGAEPGGGRGGVVLRRRREPRGTGRRATRFVGSGFFGRVVPWPDPNAVVGEVPGKTRLR